jgi:YggT family protein
MAFLITIVDLVVRILSLVVIVYVFLGYFMSPFHPIRETLNRIVEPLLGPIRRVVPMIGMLDLSPLILLILIQVLGQIVISILRSVG